MKFLLSIFTVISLFHLFGQSQNNNQSSNKNCNIAPIVEEFPIIFENSSTYTFNQLNDFIIRKEHDEAKMLEAIAKDNNPGMADDYNKVHSALEKVAIGSYFKKQTDSFVVLSLDNVNRLKEIQKILQRNKIEITYLEFIHHACDNCKKYPNPYIYKKEKENELRKLKDSLSKVDESVAKNYNILHQLCGVKTNLFKNINRFKLNTDQYINEQLNSKEFESTILSSVNDYNNAISHYNLVKGAIKAKEKEIENITFCKAKCEFADKTYRIKKSNFDSFMKKCNTISQNEFNVCLQVKEQNLSNIKLDISNAKNLLSQITTQETYNQSFKWKITLAVSILLGLILFFFFFGTLYKAGDHVKEKLIGETGLQFITIFVIIIAVILFGVMNILKGSELAAILSAIAGYILGKTTNQKSDKQLEVELELYKLKEEMRQKEASKQEKDTK